MAAEEAAAAKAAVTAVRRAQGRHDALSAIDGHVSAAAWLASLTKEASRAAGDAAAKESASRWQLEVPELRQLELQLEAELQAGLKAQLAAELRAGLKANPQLEAELKGGLKAGPRPASELKAGLEAGHTAGSTVERRLFGSLSHWVRYHGRYGTRVHRRAAALRQARRDI